MGKILFDLAGGQKELQWSEIGKVSLEQVLGVIRSLVLDMLNCDVC